MCPRMGAGTFPNNLSVILRDLIHEFQPLLWVKCQGFLVDDQPNMHHDATLGCDFLILTEFDISYSTKQMKWQGRSVALKHVMI